LAPLRIFIVTLYSLYQANRISPEIGASLARSCETAGYRNVRNNWVEFRTDSSVIENMIMVYDEIRAAVDSNGILPAAEVDRQQKILESLDGQELPPVWGMYRVACEV